MAYVDWTDQALDTLARHDAWRVGQGWEPIARDIYEAAEAFFAMQDPEVPPHFVPGKPVRRLGHPIDLRVVLLTVRSKPYRLLFRYRHGIFLIRGVLHPRAK